MENSQTTSGIDIQKCEKDSIVQYKESIVGSLSLPPTAWGAEWHFLVPGQTCQWTELPNHPPAFAGSPLKEKMWCRETCSLSSLLLLSLLFYNAGKTEKGEIYRTIWKVLY